MAEGAEVQLWWGSLLQADRDLLPLLDEIERARVSALDRPADQGRSMVGAALLRTAVAADLGCPPSQVLLDRTCADCGEQHGSPRVRGPLPSTRDLPPWVSVAHSGFVVVVALCRTHPVGVDVQRLADLDSTTDGWTWVSGESRLKAGAPDRPTTDSDVTWSGPVDVPLAGYLAALTVCGTTAPPRVQQHPRVPPI
ncbi:4'-phosphopantetheinyl transferase family protein [Ornithinimicrobium cryptoxanthini]|uniref:4'-phosphopantetheinyl transferase family protein n=1 Tax=Ornithinimicrobium cryptoxanthini TaxID=2934161 RepID=UPI002117DB9E|nr:hypothetical protein [Ornithinimicrobium cryptoxanthini]